MRILKMIFSRWLITAGIVLALFPVVATSQVNVVHLSDNQAVSDKDGIIYSLPRTVINISVVVNRIQKIKGPYADFADKYLGLNNIITNNSIEYDLKEINLSTFAEPDPEQFYFVELQGKSSRKGKSVEMYLSEAGLLQDATDVAKMKNTHNSESKTQKESANSFADILNPTIFEHFDTIIRRVSVDTTTIEQKIFRKITNEKNTEEKARDAADIIIELDEDKLDLLSGEQEIGFGSNLDYMYSHLESLKSEYLALFKGITSVSATTFNFSFTPKQGDTTQSITLCRFSKLNGIVDKSSPLGEPVTLEVQSQGLTKQIAEYIKLKNTDKKRSHGFSYRIPDNAKIILSDGDQVMLETIFSINQFGIISSVPASNFSSIRVHPATGGIKKVILE